MVDAEFLLPAVLLPAAVLVASLSLAVLFPLTGRVAERNTLSAGLLILADFENLLLLMVVLFIAAGKAADEVNILSGQLLCVVDAKIGVARTVSFTPKDEIGCSFRQGALVAVPDAERDFAKKEFNALLAVAFE